MATTAGERDGWREIVVVATLTVVVATAGSALTEIGPWYRGLEKPSFQPPDWAFPLGWTIIFTLAAISAVLAWRGAETPTQRRGVAVLFVANAVLNVSWSALFFFLQRPDWALVEVAFLWASILALVVYLWRISRTASLLLFPYLGWVTFASALNAGVVSLNP